MANKYNNERNKYSGAIGESWIEFAEADRHYLADCGILPADGSKFIHDVLRGEALQFYTHHAPFASLEIAIKTIESELNSRTRQNQVKN